MKLLLLSNSTAPGKAYLEHARDVIAETLRDVSEVVFVPHALADHGGYVDRVARAFAPLGIAVIGAHQGNPADLFRPDRGVFVGGGNTFRLFDALQRLGIGDAIRRAVDQGAPYLGSSAGTNAATPSLRTTNDMPILQPATFEGLGFVPFQINPHYLDPDPLSRHQGETREQRILQYLEVDPGPVLAMREGTWLLRHDDTLRLDGDVGGARLFAGGEVPRELPGGTDLSGLLDS